MARAFPWLAAVLIFFFARVDFLFTNLTSRIWRDPQIRCRPQRRAVVSQTVMEDTETWIFLLKEVWFYDIFVGNGSDLCFFWSTLNTFEWLVTLKFYESGGSIDVHSFLVWVDIFPIIFFHGILGPRKCCQSRIYTVPYSVCWDATSIRVKRPSSTGGMGDDADGKWRFIWIPSQKDVSKKPSWWLASCERGWGVVPNYIPSLKLTKMDGWKTTKIVLFGGKRPIFQRTNC